MKIHPQDNGLLIEPESEFERRWLTLTFGDCNPIRVFLKRGLNNFLIGLKIRIDKENND